MRLGPRAVPGKGGVPWCPTWGGRVASGPLPGVVMAQEPFPILHLQSPGGLSLPGCQAPARVYHEMTTPRPPCSTQTHVGSTVTDGVSVQRCLCLRVQNFPFLKICCLFSN